MSSAKVNKKLLLFKIHYFLKNGGVAFLPFFAPIIIQRGISPRGVGIIWTLTPLVSAAFTILSGVIADAWKLHKSILVITCALLAASFTVFFFLPAVPESKIPTRKSLLSMFCFRNHSSIDMCLSQVNITNIYNMTIREYNENFGDEDCKFICKNTILPVQSEQIWGNSCVSESICIYCRANISKGGICIVLNGTVKHEGLNNDTINCMLDSYSDCEELCDDSEESQKITPDNSLGTLSFWINALIIILIFIAMDSSSSLADTMCLAALGEEHDKYGQQRLFGALGWGLMGVIMGALVTLYSESETNYTPALVITASLLLCNLFFSLLIDVKVPGRKRSSGVRQMLLSFPCISLLATSLVIGATMGLICTFEFIYLKEVSLKWNADFSYTNLLQGIIIFIDCIVGEMPFMFLSGYIINKVGNAHTFSLNLAASTCRLFLYAVITNPWLFVLIHLLHGISFGVFLANMVSCANRLAPEGSQATLQSMTLASYTIGKSLGALLGGFFMESIGGSKTFMTLTLVLTIYTIVYISVHCIIQRRATHGVSSMFSKVNNESTTNNINTGDDKQVNEKENMLEKAITSEER